MIDAVIGDIVVQVDGGIGGDIFLDFFQGPLV